MHRSPARIVPHFEAGICNVPSSAFLVPDFSTRSTSHSTQEHEDDEGLFDLYKLAANCADFVLEEEEEEGMDRPFLSKEAIERAAHSAKGKWSEGAPVVIVAREFSSRFGAIYRRRQEGGADVGVGALVQAVKEELGIPDLIASAFKPLVASATALGYVNSREPDVNSREP